MKVLCINGEFTPDNNCEAVRNILKVGDDHLLPKLGQIYEVIGHAYWDYHPDAGGPASAYELDLPDHSHYGAKIVFSTSRFVVIDEDFIPNYIIPDGPMKGQLARSEKCYFSFSFDKDSTP